MIGTPRINRKGNLNKVITTKLKHGEVIAKENSNGITILKWKDKREFCRKPKMVDEYNTGKTAIWSFWSNECV